jgi:hypothetical protein
MVFSKTGILVQTLRLSEQRFAIILAKYLEKIEKTISKSAIYKVF